MNLLHYENTNTRATATPSKASKIPLEKLALSSEKYAFPLGNCNFLQ